MLGLHLLIPLIAARLPVERRPLLGLLLAPSLLAALILRLLWSLPDDAAEAGLVAGSRATSVVLICLAALILADLVAFLGGARLEPAGWWILTAFGFGGALAFAWIAETLARGPAAGTSGALLAAGARVVLMLALAEVIAGLRPRWAVVAGVIAIPLLWLSLPTLVRGAAFTLGAPPAFVAAAVLLTVATWLPLRLRRPAAAAGAVTAWLAIAALEIAWRGGRIVLDTLPIQELAL